MRLARDCSPRTQAHTHTQTPTRGPNKEGGTSFVNRNQGRSSSARRARARARSLSLSHSCSLALSRARSLALALARALTRSRSRSTGKIRRHTDKARPVPTPHVYGIPYINSPRPQSTHTHTPPPPRTLFHYEFHTKNQSTRLHPLRSAAHTQPRCCTHAPSRKHRRPPKPHQRYRTSSNHKSNSPALVTRTFSRVLTNVGLPAEVSGSARRHERR